MNFWTVSYTVDGHDKKIKKCLAAPKSFKKDKLKKDLRDANPEIKNLTLKKSKKPAGWKLFMCNET